MNTSLLSTILRVGLAFAFLVPGVTAFISPGEWLSFIPAPLMELLGGHLELAGYLFAAFELIVAGALLFMKDPRIPAYIATAVLFAIVLAHITSYAIFLVVFRDVSIAFLGIALISIHTPNNQ